MKPSLHLFELIQSLNPQEKRAFVKAQRHRKRGGKQLYLEFFKAIEAQKVFDEHALKAHFEGTSFGKSLAFPKSHLYERVMRSLQSFHYGQSVEGEFHSELDRIQLLMDRGLPGHADRILKKSLKRAISLERPTQVIQLLRRKRSILLRLQKENFVAEIGKICESEVKWQSRLLTEQAALSLHDELYAHFQEARRKAEARTTEWMLEARNRLNSLQEASNLTFAAQVAILRAHTHYHYMLEDFRGVHDAYQQEIKVWETHPEQIQADEIRFIRAFGNWLGSKALIQDYGNLLTEIERLRSRENLGPRGMALVFQITYNLELFYYMNAGRPGAALPLAPSIDAGLKKHEGYVVPSARLGFYFNLSLIFLLSGQPEGGVKWVNRILQFERGEIRKDIRAFAPLLMQVLNFELGNLSHLESWFRSVKYRHNRKQTVSGVELALFELIKEGVSSAYPTRQPALFERFIQAIETYAKEPGVSRVGLMELILWAKQKL